MLPVAYYTCIALTLGLTYIASVCHQNQVLKHTGDLTKIQKLPYDLHDSSRFTQVVIFLSLNLSYVWYATYAAALLLCVYSGFYLFPATIISMVIMDQLYQQRWFPKFMETPYFLLSTVLQIFVVFGFSNWFWLGLSVVNVAFFAWDYVQTHLRGVQSASCQFPMASKRQQLSFDDLLEGTNQRPTNKAELDRILDKFKNPAVRVTFNHFRDASVVIDRLIGNAPTVDFNEFDTLFNQMDFQDPTLRASILNQMALNDKFNQKEISHYRQTFHMDADADVVDVQIAYLKKEMKEAVTKLVSPAYKGLDHQQVNTMRGQAGLVLDFILTKSPDEIKKRHILLSVAIQAGSHCFRQFSETFAELFHAHVYKEAPLSLRDNAVLVAQSVREVKFKDYYYHVYDALRLWNMHSASVDALLTADKNEYHAYENFAIQYGQFFYLQNQTLSQRTRSIQDIIKDYMNRHLVLPTAGLLYAEKYPQEAPKKCLFSDHYNAECLIQSALPGNRIYKNSEKNLFKIFEAWCDAIYPGAYREVTLDEDYFPVPVTDKRLRALVKLMLLDFGLVELVPLKEATLSSLFNEIFMFTPPVLSRDELTVRQDADDLLQRMDTSNQRKSKPSFSIGSILQSLFASRKREKHPSESTDQLISSEEAGDSELFFDC